jgi:transposase
MRTKGSPAAFEQRRRLAVQRVLEGYFAVEVADFLGVDPGSVRRWVASFREHGSAGLAARPASGRPPKLTTVQEKIVRRWLADCPTEHGLATELWTAARLAQLIEQEWGVRFRPEYLTVWLRERGFTPQQPRRRPRERDPAAIPRWLAQDWPRIKKRPAGGASTSSGWTRADC